MQFMIWIIIMTSLFFLISLFTKKKHFVKEKFSPFECGFDPFSVSRLPFSLRFYMMTIILIFDIEIILLPVPIITNMSHKSYPTAFLIIIFIIFIGLMYEWKKEMIEWLK